MQHKQNNKDKTNKQQRKQPTKNTHCKKTKTQETNINIKYNKENKYNM